MNFIHLLTRISWAVSLALAYAIVISSVGAKSDFEYFISITLISLLIATIIKRIFFSKKYIKKCVNDFADDVVRYNRQEILENLEESSIQKNIPEVSQEIEKPTDIQYEEIYKTKQQEVAYQNNSISSGQDSPKELQDQQTVYEQKADGISKTLKDFFSVNPLAKIGGIIFFIGVIFLMSILYTAIGPVGKILIGFMLGFGTYGVGVWLDGKGFIGESRVLMGLGILINYFVILGGRYLISNATGCSGVCDVNSGFLPAGVTFGLLIFNTIVGIYTGLYYRSSAMLIFMFIFAYLNPILVGSDSESSYIYLGYTLIVTAGAYVIAVKQKNLYIFAVSCILAFISILLTPINSINELTVQFICYDILVAGTLYLGVQLQEQGKKYMLHAFVSLLFFGLDVLAVNGQAYINSGILILFFVSIFGILLFCYSYAQKSHYLYSAGTIGFSLSMALIVNIFGISDNALLIIVSTSIFFILNTGFVLQASKAYIDENLSDVALGLTIGSLLIGYLLYQLGNIYFPGIMLGYAFALLSFIYACIGYIIFKKSSLTLDTVESSEESTILYTLIAISLGLFSLAIALVFSKYPGVITLLWVIEGTIAITVSQKLHSQRVLWTGLIIYSIGIIKLALFSVSLWHYELTGNYGMLISLFFITILSYVNIRSLYISGIHKREPAAMIFLEVFTTFSLGLVLAYSIEIFKINEDYVKILFSTGYVVIISVIYRTIWEKHMMIVLDIALGFIYFIHIAYLIDGFQSTDFIFSVLSLVFPIGIYIYEYSQKKEIISKTSLGIYILYLFLATTLYVNHFFPVSYSVTIYWGVLAFSVLWYGIKNDNIAIRTIGFYLLGLTIVKIFIYDIWQSDVADGAGYVAFILTGILMITLSVLYTKKYGNISMADFSPENIFPQFSHAPIAENMDKTMSDTTLSEKEKLKNSIDTTQLGDTIAMKIKPKGSKKTITVKSENLIKIGIIIENMFEKKNFSPEELREVFEYFKKYYDSELPENQYDYVISVLEDFVTSGGDIDFVGK